MRTNTVTRRSVPLTPARLERVRTPIRVERMAARIFLWDLAEAAGLTPSMLSRAELGNYPLSPANEKKRADALARLIRETDERN